MCRLSRHRAAVCTHDAALAPALVLSGASRAHSEPGHRTLLLPNQTVQVLVKLVSPFAPHLGEEMWQQLGHANSLAYEQWPQYDEALTVSNTVTLGIQVNGKTRGELTLSVEATEDEARELAAKVESVAKFVDGKTVKKFIYRPGKIINFVVGN